MQEKRKEKIILRLISGLQIGRIRCGWRYTAGQ
jgi:hypothetical protein